jgi:hypothetical protein
MIEIDSDFPGGNIEVRDAEGDVVHLAPDLRDTEGKWFYWYFRARGAGARNVRFVFEDECVGVRGPGVSLDAGQTWQWLGTDSADERSFTYSFPPQPAAVRFSFGMPYTAANLAALLGERTAGAAGPHIRIETLCMSRKGRPVVAISVGQLSAETRHRVLVACRHHACEMMASYALEGLVDAVLADDEAGRWLRDQVEFLLVPFVDADGVEDGDQGKMRRPHDHNRDYAAPCLYPEVQALREKAKAWSGGRMRMVLDLHCPGHRGHYHERIHFVGVPNETLWERVSRFSDVLERVAQGPLPYRRSNNLAFGEDWNTEADPPGAEPSTFSEWMSALPGVWFGTTLEIPYANADGAEVNADSARAFGRDLGRAIQHHLAGDADG